MTESEAYPSIDPSSFDLIVLGTGLPQSLIASAASASGKSVLHLDPNPFYGSFFSSLSLQPFSSFLGSDSPCNHYEETCTECFRVVPLSTRHILSDVNFLSSETVECSRRFSLDISGPRVLFCADPMVGVMIRSGANHHMEFKSLDANFIYCDGGLTPVLDTRAAIFKDRSLSLTEKNQMMRFLKLVREHLEFDGDAEKRISEEDLEIPFVDFLAKQKLPSKIKSIILYAIVMANYDQEGEECTHIITTREGIESLSIYHSSIGRLQNTTGAFLYPVYGQGELPQAFCRCAAVKGALYVLRMPVTHLLIDEAQDHYKGVRLASGQDIFSTHLVMDPSFVLPSSPSHYPQGNSALSNCNESANGSTSDKRVIRGVCIIRGSIKSDMSNLLIIFPPRSLSAKQASTIRALQLGSNLAICPPDLFVVYLSTISDDIVQGKDSLHKAMNSLFASSSSNNSVSDSLEKNDCGERIPILLWSAVYVQDLTEFHASQKNIISCPVPDGNLDYRDLMASTQMIFQKLFPEEEFFPQKPASQNTDEDDGPLD